MSELTTLKGRCMYVFKLKPVLDAEEGGIDNFIRKAKRAQFSSIWIKVAEGRSHSENITGKMKDTFKDVVAQLGREEIDVWGWHIPLAATSEAAKEEAKLVAEIAYDFGLSGILMDAEAGNDFFRGNATTASEYSKELQSLLAAQSKGLAVSSHDIPSPQFPFDAFAKHATVNAPQVYYGRSSSVGNRLNRAIKANSHVEVPFIPVGAGWIEKRGKSEGGCVNAAACAERAVTFMNLVHKHQFQGYSFWHWLAVPAELWEVFFTVPATVPVSGDVIPLVYGQTVSDVLIYDQIHRMTTTNRQKSFDRVQLLNLVQLFESFDSVRSADKACIPELIRLGSDVDGIAKAQEIAKKAWSRFPDNGCAANLSALLQLAGIKEVPMTLGAGKLACIIEGKRGWERISVGEQQAGDIGVTFDQGTPPQADHIYLVLSVGADNDKMRISDNQDNEPHSRYASGHGRTPTEYFLRA